MIKTIDAIYENGVLRPLEPINIEENTRVRIVIKEALLPTAQDGFPEEEKENAEQMVKSARLDEQKGWEAFRRMGRGTIGSKLSDVSRKHDDYLYGKKR